MPQPLTELPACLASHGWRPIYVTAGRALWSIANPYHTDNEGKIYLSFDWGPDDQSGWVLESLDGGPPVQGTPDELATALVTYLLTKEWPQ